MRKEQWLEWRDHPVTLVLKDVVKERIAESTSQVLNSNDPEFDRVLKGIVRAYNELLDWEPEITEEETDEL
jgi:hypothetical protein